MSAGERRAFGTPDDVVETSESRAPERDPTLGVDVRVDRRGPEPKHRLVSIGDSLTHGFKSLGVAEPHLSYPAMLARALGVRDFRHPVYDGPGGLPLDLEWLLRGLEEACGEHISLWEAPEALATVHRMLDHKEEYWERGPGRQLRGHREILHNLGLYGWDVRDTLSLDADVLRAGLRETRDDLLSVFPENADRLAWLRVLDSARDRAGEALPPLRAARELGHDGGIETLTVFLGANNALGTVLKLQAVWSRDADFTDLEAKRAYTVWNPRHFAAELEHVVERVRAVDARHVLWLTIPHVTIAPLAKGFNRISRDSRYYEHYSRPWIGDEDFDPHVHRVFLTGAEARDIDRAIDQYNASIVEAVRTARLDGRDWRLVDISGVLDELAKRRYIGNERARPSWWREYVLPKELTDALRFTPDTRFLRSGAHGVFEGGLVSLDGVHPTTSAYAVIAHECMQTMLDAGVDFAEPSIDFVRAAEADTLLTRPLRSLDAGLELLEDLDGRFGVLARLEHAMRFDSP